RSNGSMTAPFGSSRWNAISNWAGVSTSGTLLPIRCWPWSAAKKSATISIVSTSMSAHLHIGALTWAAAGKDPGLTPDLIIDWAARGNRFRAEDLADVRLGKPFDLKAAKSIWLEALAQSRALVEKLPMNELGCLYLNAAGQ